MKKTLIKKEAYVAPLAAVFLTEQMQCICTSGSIPDVGEEDSGITNWNS